MSFNKSIHTAVHVENWRKLKAHVPIKLYNFSLSTAPHTSKDDGQRTYEAVGCFSKCDDCLLNFPELLFIDSGQTEHYGDTLQEYTRQFVHRCAKQSQSREFDYFGIANYGDLISYYVSFYAVLLCPFGNFAMSPCSPQRLLPVPMIVLGTLKIQKCKRAGGYFRRGHLFVLEIN